MNPTGEGKDRMVFVNPEIREREGNVEAEEGCLSLPGINVRVRRSAQCRLTAQDLQGRRFELEGKDLLARIWQHEKDHLDGILIIDRMGPTDRIATRNTLKALEEAYKERDATKTRPAAARAAGR
jgi:peptide deformylase